MTDLITVCRLCRLLAIKALNDRLNTSPAPASGWPSIVDSSAAAELNSSNSSQLSTPTVQTASTDQQLAIPAETGTSSDSSPNAAGDLVSTNAGDTL